MIEEDTETQGDESQGQYVRPFLPNHILEEIGVIFLVTGIVLLAASLLRPDELGLPHAFFAGALEMARVMSPLFTTLIILAAVVILIALPFIDRSEERHPKKRMIFVLIILALIAIWVAFTIMGF